MSAGELNKLVIIQSSSESQNTYGELVKTWSTFLEVWAGIKPVSGSEKHDGKFVDASATHRVKIRYLSGVTSKMRILWGARVLEIESVLNESERGVYMQLNCTEQV